MVRGVNAALPVEVDGDGEAAGMAAMIGDLIEANLAGSPARAWVARRVHGSVVLEASDRHFEVTVNFDGERVAVLARRLDGVFPALRAPWLTMSRVCSGLSSPVSALRRREMQLTWSTPLTVVAVAAFLLKVPRSVYLDRRIVKERTMV